MKEAMLYEQLLIKRFGFEIEKWRLTKDIRCPACGHTITIEGANSSKRFLFVPTHYLDAFFEVSRYVGDLETRRKGCFEG